MTSDDRSGGLYARAVRETLDTVAAPLVREALIHDALALAGLAVLPEDAAGLRRFASGALFTVTERALGRELAASITDEIVLRIPSVGMTAPTSRPPARRASVTPRRHPTPVPPTRKSSPVSSRTAPARGATQNPDESSVRAPVRRDTEPVVWPPGLDSAIRGPQQPVAPPQSEGRPIARSPERLRTAVREAPLVLVSTEEVLFFQTLLEWFGNRGTVCRIRTVAEIVRQLDGADGRRCIVIIDGKTPAVRPAAIAVLLEDEPQVDVVLCRVAEATEQVVLSSHPGTRRWIVYREPASLDHVAAECVRLVS